MQNFNHNHIDPYYCRTDIFKYSFFPYRVVKWNELDAYFKNAKFYMSLKVLYLKLVDQFKIHFLKFLIH